VLSERRSFASGHHGVKGAGGAPLSGCCGGGHARAGAGFIRNRRSGEPELRNIVRVGCKIFRQDGGRTTCGDRKAGADAAPVTGVAARLAPRRLTIGGTMLAARAVAGPAAA